MDFEKIDLTEDSAVDYVDITWLLPDHLVFDSKTNQFQLMYLSIKDNAPPFKELLIEFIQEDWGESLLSLNGEDWKRHLYIPYSDLSRGITTIYCMFKVTNKDSKFAFPEINFEIFHR